MSNQPRFVHYSNFVIKLMGTTSEQKNEPISANAPINKLTQGFYIFNSCSFDKFKRLWQIECHVCLHNVIQIRHDLTAFANWLWSFCIFRIKMTSRFLDFTFLTSTLILTPEHMWICQQTLNGTFHTHFAQFLKHNAKSKQSRLYFEPLWNTPIFVASPSETLF